MSDWYDQLILPAILQLSLVCFRIFKALHGEKSKKNNVIVAEKEKFSTTRIKSFLLKYSVMCIENILVGKCCHNIHRKHLN